MDHWAIFTYKTKIGIRFPEDEEAKKTLVDYLFEQDIPAGVGVDLFV